MAGREKHLMGSKGTRRSKGNPAVAKVVKAKFVLEGINPDEYPAGGCVHPANIQ